MQRTIKAKILVRVHTHTHTISLNNIVNIKNKKGNIGLSGKYYDTG